MPRKSVLLAVLRALGVTFAHVQAVQRRVQGGVLIFTWEWLFTFPTGTLVLAFTRWRDFGSWRSARCSRSVDVGWNGTHMTTVPWRSGDIQSECMRVVATQELGRLAVARGIILLGEVWGVFRVTGHSPYVYRVRL